MIKTEDALLISQNSTVANVIASQQRYIAKSPIASNWYFFR
jgi:hypothetical protein